PAGHRWGGGVAAAGRVSGGASVPAMPGGAGGGGYGLGLGPEDAPLLPRLVGGIAQETGYRGRVLVGGYQSGTVLHPVGETHHPARTARTAPRPARSSHPVGGAAAGHRAGHGHDPDPRPDPRDPRAVEAVGRVRSRRAAGAAHRSAGGHADPA